MIYFSILKMGCNESNVDVSVKRHLSKEDVFVTDLHNKFPNLSLQGKQAMNLLEHSLIIASKVPLYTLKVRLHWELW